MGRVTFDYSQAKTFVGESEIASYQEKVRACHELLHGRRGKGNEYLGWLDYPRDPEREEVARIKAAAQRIRDGAEVFVVVGIGGSYLGARAAIEMLTHTFYNDLSREKRGGPRILFAGHQVSGTYLSDLLEILEGRDFSVNMISKSGNTLEPALTFQALRELLEKRYGEKGAAERIYVTTDQEKGKLRQLAREKGYEAFRVPRDIGGRYSVLSAVGLLPIAVAGIDIDEMLEGAARAAEELAEPELEKNPCYQYAVLRNIFYSQGKGIELFVSYEPQLHYLGEWYKQLFGESEGKEGQGIFPMTIHFTTDLHSLGQYIQEGERSFFETVVSIENPRKDFRVEGDRYSFNEINKIAMKATAAAHTEGGVPNLFLRIPQLTPYYFGYFVYFLMKACAISGYLLGINPFDQPGVEKYKEKMKELMK